MPLPALTYPDSRIKIWIYNDKENNMEKIASFTINHDTLVPGIYTSRIDMGDIYTYDLRMKKPNCGSYLSPAGAHTIEHIFATYLRSSSIKDGVIYFGPMGCLTGFYLVVRGIAPEDVISAVQDAARFTAGFEGEIPGSGKKECGNYLMHDIISAKKEAAEYTAAIDGWTVSDLKYKD